MIDTHPSRDMLKTDLSSCICSSGPQIYITTETDRTYGIQIFCVKY